MLFHCYEPLYIIISGAKDDQVSSPESSGQVKATPGVRLGGEDHGATRDAHVAQKLPLTRKQKKFQQ